jgi:hypothetical protein
MNPGRADVPTDLSVQFAVAGALARRADRRNFDAILTYADRMGDEMAAYIVQDATLRDPSVANTPAFTKFATSHQDIML